jgi:thioredoxin-dependent peroxiredoxin
MPCGVHSTTATARGPVGSFFLCEKTGTTNNKTASSQNTVRRVIIFFLWGADHMDTNDKVPDFTLLDQNGEKVSLKDFKGKTVVLFFYPKADTPGWTIEASEFRDDYKQFQKAGAVVLGISPDKPEAQKKFADKYKINFPLLSDIDKEVAKTFDVYKEKNMYGKKVMGIERSTFVIGPDGKLKNAFRKVKVEGHSAEMLAAVKE